MRSKYCLYGIFALAIIGVVLISGCISQGKPGGVVVPSNKSEPAPEISFSESNIKLERGMAGIGAFVIGGDVYLLTYTDKATIYKLSQDRLEKVIDGKDYGFIKRGSFNVEVVDNKAYIIGGAPDKTKTGCSAKVSTGTEYDCSTNEVWVFDPVSKTLKQTAKMKKQLEVLSSGVVDGKIYVLGGWFPNEENLNENSIEVFDGVEWNEIQYFGKYYPVRSAAYAVVGKKIYLFGGCLRTDINNPATFSCNTQYTQIFDTETNTFSQGEKMPVDGRHFSGQHTFVKGKYIYVFGGATSLSNNIFDDVAVYNTETDTWEVLDGKLTAKRKSVASAFDGKRLWIFGGISCKPPDKCPSQGGDKIALDSVEYGELGGI